MRLVVDGEQLTVRRQDDGGVEDASLAEDDSRYHLRGAGVEGRPQLRRIGNGEGAVASFNDAASLITQREIEKSVAADDARDSGAHATGSRWPADSGES